MTNNTFALVLSSGGVTGVAWETGLLKGLRDAGLDLTPSGASVDEPGLPLHMDGGLRSPSNADPVGNSCCDE